MISHEIYEFTRFTFAEMRFAGELKGLGDVRIRTKIDRNAPTRQEGLLAMFLHGIGDTDIGAGATILANTDNGFMRISVAPGLCSSEVFATGTRLQQFGTRRIHKIHCL